MDLNVSVNIAEDRNYDNDDTFQFGVGNSGDGPDDFCYFRNLRVYGTAIPPTISPTIIPTASPTETPSFPPTIPPSSYNSTTSQPSYIPPIEPTNVPTKGPISMSMPIIIATPAPLSSSPVNTNTEPSSFQSDEDKQSRNRVSQHLTLIIIACIASVLIVCAIIWIIYCCRKKYKNRVKRKRVATHIKKFNRRHLEIVPAYSNTSASPSPISKLDEEIKTLADYDHHHSHSPLPKIVPMNCSDDHDLGIQSPIQSKNTILSDDGVLTPRMDYTLKGDEYNGEIESGMPGKSTNLEQNLSKEVDEIFESVQLHTIREEVPIIDDHMRAKIHGEKVVHDGPKLETNESEQMYDDKYRVKTPDGDKDTNTKFTPNEDTETETLDEKGFLKWDHHEILQWILSLDNGLFSKYEDLLRSSLIEENVKGHHLRDVNVLHIKGWGVNDFEHKQLLSDHIQALVTVSNE